MRIGAVSHLFDRLRKLKHTHYLDADRQGEKARLEKLLKAIANDIIQCGSDLHYYTGRKFLCKNFLTVLGEIQNSDLNDLYT